MSCSFTKSDKTISEGVIEYKTDVINTDHPLTLYAPTSATLKLKGNKWIIEMSKLGFFNVGFLCNLNDNTLSQMIKCLDIKNACVDSVAELKKENDQYLLNFKFTSDTKIIAGYTCKKVIATKVSEPEKSFDVYYTEEIGTENSNALTPYKSIKGMLMDYQIMRLGLEMRFIATQVKKEEINDAELEIPQIFNKLTRQKFDEEFNLLFADFL